MIILFTWGRLRLMVILSVFCILFLGVFNVGLFWRGRSPANITLGMTTHHTVADLSSPVLVANSSLAWGPDPDTPSPSESLDNVRFDHPRLFASKFRWNRLTELIAVEPYLNNWNKTIFENATTFLAKAPVTYNIDGELTGSGVLDVAREFQLRIKHWAYAYRLSNDRKWVDRTWEELIVASGNSTQYFGTPGDNWNTQYILPIFDITFSFGLHRTGTGSTLASL